VADEVAVCGVRCAVCGVGLACSRAAGDPGSCWVEQRAQNGRWELAPQRSSREHQVRMGSDWDFLEAGSLCL
jgi:hypothetical protein